MGYKFTEDQIRVLNEWPKSEPNLRAVFNLYSSPGFGDLLDMLNALFDVSTKTEDYIIQDSDRIILADASGGVVTITLPAATEDRLVWIKRINNSGSNVIIATPGSETIDGGASLTLSVAQTSYTLSSDGSNWHIV